jgi:hypothetical protein
MGTELPTKVMLVQTLVLMQITWWINLWKVGRLVLSRTSYYGFQRTKLIMRLNSGIPDFRKWFNSSCIRMEICRSLHITKRHVINKREIEGIVDKNGQNDFRDNCNTDMYLKTVCYNM